MIPFRYVNLSINKIKQPWTNSASLISPISPSNDFSSQTNSPDTTFRNPTFHDTSIKKTHKQRLKICCKLYRVGHFGKHSYLVTSLAISGIIDPTTNNPNSRAIVPLLCLGSLVVLRLLRHGIAWNNRHWYRQTASQAYNLTLTVLRCKAVEMQAEYVYVRFDPRIYGLFIGFLVRKREI